MLNFAFEFLLVTFVILEIVLCHFDKHVASGITLVIGVGLLMFTSNPVGELLTPFIAENGPWLTLIEYFLVGIVVAILKWVFFTIKISQQLKAKTKQLRQKLAAELATDSTANSNRAAGGGAGDAEKIVRIKLCEWAIDNYDKLYNNQLPLSSNESLRALNNKIAPAVRCVAHPENCTPYLPRELVIGALTPQIKNYIDAFTSWVLTWPAVVVLLAFDHLIVKLTEHIANMFNLGWSKVTRYLISRAI